MLAINKYDGFRPVLKMRDAPLTHFHVSDVSCVKLYILKKFNIFLNVIFRKDCSVCTKF